jgi:hypothetical protein
LRGETVEDQVQIDFPGDGDVELGHGGGSFVFLFCANC